MADLLVSRIQNRRGRQVDLPQPLRPGEFGLCLDTGKLFIGGDETLTPSGVQVFPGLFSTAQSILDNQILSVDVSGVGSFDLDAFRIYMNASVNLPTAEAQITPTSVAIPEEQIEYDSVSELVYIGFTVAQATSTVPPGGVGSSIDQSTDGYQIDIAAFDAGIAVGDINQVNFTVDANGTFTTSTHETANALAAIMNELNGTVGLATTKLNIEVLTEFLSPEDQVFDPVEYTLPASVPFADFPSPGIEYDATVTDTILQEYSVHLDDGSNYYNSTGSMKVTVIPSQSLTSLVDEFVDQESPAAVGTIEFQSVFVGPSTVKLQYKHNFPASVDFKAITRRWLSF